MRAALNAASVAVKNLIIVLKFVKPTALSVQFPATSIKIGISTYSVSPLVLFNRNINKIFRPILFLFGPAFRHPLSG